MPILESASRSSDELRQAGIASERTGEKVVVDQAMVDELLGETGDDEDLIRYDL